MVEGDAFGAQEGDFTRDLGTVSVSVESADAAVDGQHAVAGDVRRERVVPQRAPDGLGGGAGDTPGECAIRRDIPLGNIKERDVNLAAEIRNAGVALDLSADG